MKYESEDYFDFPAEPASEKSPYSRLKEKHKLKIDFRPFIHVEGLSAKEVRLQKINFSDFDNVILTSRNAVDHFFRITQRCATRYQILPNIFANPKRWLITSKNMWSTGSVKYM